ncbi:MAG: pitrilysin family protein [Oscillatoria sp. PMC 1051.18]|nr:pitrilysin family protein [Oscillatoria sp. PMC 1050.18]MEC5033121.1 pitrilysin family protein [Oscillatoria sp. PMC 1051.18]
MHQKSPTTRQPKQKINRCVLNNGITVISAENMAADIVAGRIFFKNAGATGEAREAAGRAHLLSATITKGCGELSSLEIAEKVESVGASLGADAASDYFLVSLKTVSADFAQMLQLTAQMLRSPTFPTEEVELEKNLSLQNIRSQQEQPFNVAFNQLRQAMYPHHPYGVSILGKEETVSGLSRADLEQHHQIYFRPDNMVISLSGRLTQAEAVKLVEHTFGDWQAPNTSLPIPKLAELTSQPSLEITPQETQQSIIMLGYLTPSIKEKDYFALKLLNTYLGNGLSSRLFVELREKRGLAYDVSAFYPTRMDKSNFVVYIGTAPGNTATSIEGLHTEVKRLCQTELTAEELQAAKNKLLGQYALGKQSNSEIAQIFGWYETIGLGIEFDSYFQNAIANITPEIAQQVACRYFRESPYLSIVGPAEAVEGHSLPQ